MKIVLPVPATEIRSDPAGNGSFKARRGSRIHKGVDLVCEPGDLVVAPFDGKITKIGYPYADDLSYRYVEITTESGLVCRIFYVEPTFTLGWEVKAGDQIGFAQDVSERYKLDSRGGIRYRTNQMLPHVHVELRCTEAHIAAKTKEKCVFLDLALFFDLE
jgi:murein DD-endopeptidase MepM/ murein hydrolase activator NlpD